MKVRVVADFNWESKLDHAMRPLDLKSAFVSRSYGSDVQSLLIDLMCRSSYLNFRQRVRYDKANAAFSLDIMLNIEQFALASHQQRRELVAAALVKDIPAALAKRRFKHFDLPAFTHDLEVIVNQQLLAPEAKRFDHLSLERATGVGS